MRRGTRTIFKACACGCGQNVPPYISPTTNRVKAYPKFIPGHGAKDWGKRWARRLKQSGHPKSKPVGSKQSRRDGYIKIKCPDGRWRYEHRVVARAQSGEHVHHVDGNPANNSPENLQIIEPGEHTRQHLTIHTWSKISAACIDCGETSRAHYGRGLCTRCWQRQRAKRLGYWPH